MGGQGPNIGLARQRGGAGDLAPISSWQVIHDLGIGCADADLVEIVDHDVSGLPRLDRAAIVPPSMRAGKVLNFWRMGSRLVAPRSRTSQPIRSLP